MTTLTADETITLFLPFPPTVNHYYATRGSMRFITSRGREFRERVAAECLAQGLRAPLAHDLDVTATLYAPDRKTRDLDNYMKALLDALTHAGAWRDDSQIARLLILRGITRKPGLCRVDVRHHASMPIEWPRELQGATK